MSLEFCRYFSDEFLTTTTVIFFIGMSSESRRKIPTSHVFSEIRRKWSTEFRRLQIFCLRRKSVTNVRRHWSPSEPPLEFGVFSCSVHTCAKFIPNKLCLIVWLYYITQVKYTYKLDSFIPLWQQVFIYLFLSFLYNFWVECQFS